MMVDIRSRLTFANVTSIVALFVALGGTSFAAVTLSKNSVRTKHIKNGDVKRHDIAGNAVASGKVLDASLLARDFRPGQLPAGPQGPRGEQGNTGPTGPKGDTGTVDTSNFYDKSASDARFLGTTAQAKDSDTLDGNDSSDFTPASTVLRPVRSRLLNGNTATLFSANGLSLINDCSDGANARVVVRAAPGNAATVIASVATSTTLAATDIYGNSPTGDRLAVASTTGAAGPTRGEFNAALFDGPSNNQTLSGSFYVVRVGAFCEVVAFGVAG